MVKLDIPLQKLCLIYRLKQYAPINNVNAKSIVCFIATSFHNSHLKEIPLASIIFLKPHTDTHNELGVFHDTTTY